MKKFLFLFFLTVVFLSSFRCENNASIVIEYYITPRNVNYGILDNGVFRFDLNRNSVKVPSSQSSYYCNIRMDSVHELFFIQKNIGEKERGQVFNFQKNLRPKPFMHPRILIITHYQNKNDSLKIDENMNAFYKHDIYSLSSSYIENLISIMPTELKESWENNLPGK